MNNIFEGVDLKDVAIIISGLITAISTITAMIVTSRYNLKIAKANIENQNKQKEYELKIQRIEDFYYLYEKWEMGYQLIYLDFLRCYFGKKDFKQVMEAPEELNKLLPGELQKIQMLLNIHFPELLIHHSKVNAARKLITPFLTDPNSSGLKKEDFFRLQESFEKVSRDFKNETAKIAQKIKIH
ncbi:hypothetical protein [Janthinobacterium lividum]|uniref:DUF4760 domain-containing protein n=1 Tax=Janthinobacterium lividum TaxID=29581 RepID=A0ABU0XZ92_9BURK|nr:hypothetical protein [Janthinobacterium lividum]MDQ4628688.1 hypothetical protein [Janthinobacterium lividum]MDQ4677110.1 hypothetical protein [Janthinobacterium lividum]MDQ4687647.1 hypothetical protein [Janthinobacterium lividum]